MNSIFGMLTLQERFMLTLQETRSIHDSMNIPEIEYIPYINLHLNINI